MALRYEKLTAEQDIMRGVLEKGEYPFSVKSCKQGITKSGDYNMLTVELILLDSKGSQHPLKDWILLDCKDMAWKFRHFCATIGMLENYDAGDIDPFDIPGKNGVAKVSVEEYEDDGEIKKSNKIKDYVKPGEAKGNTSPDKMNDFVDDDIPL